jgi:hypothetical protein
MATKPSSGNAHLRHAVYTSGTAGTRPSHWTSATAFESKHRKARKLANQWPKITP